MKYLFWLSVFLAATVQSLPTDDYTNDPGKCCSHSDCTRVPNKSKCSFWGTCVSGTIPRTCNSPSDCTPCAPVCTGAGQCQPGQQGGGGGGGGGGQPLPLGPYPGAGGRNCGTRSGSKSGSRDASQGEFPWTCALFKMNHGRGADEFVGNCAIIPSGENPYEDTDGNVHQVKVITTKDVMSLMPKDSAKVRVGTVDLNGYNHQDHVITGFNDKQDPVVIFNVNPPIQLNSQVSAACLPENRRSTGGECWVSGWGREGGRQHKASSWGESSRITGGAPMVCNENGQWTVVGLKKSGGDTINISDHLAYIGQFKFG